MVNAIWFSVQYFTVGDKKGRFSMKKLISMVLAVVIAMSLATTAFAAEGVGGFTDVPSGAWYTEELAYALEKGFVSGTSASSFSPDANARCDIWRRLL